MSDGIGRASLDAVAAEDAAVVVDVVSLGVALARRNANFLGVIRCLDKDAIGGAGCCAQKAGYALFQAIFVALQLVSAAKTLLELRSPQRPWAVRVVFHLRRLQHLLEGDAHALSNPRDIAHDRHRLSIRRFAAWTTSQCGQLESRFLKDVRVLTVRSAIYSLRNI